jgi:hyaluronan synthase
VAAEACKPFVDPKVGGVGTRQNVYNPKGFLQRVNDMYLDYRYFDENAAQSRIRSGCTKSKLAIGRKSGFGTHWAITVPSAGIDR